MKLVITLLTLISSAALVAAKPLCQHVPVRGWTLLSKSEPDDIVVIDAAKDYGINHLQLSHHIVHDLIDLKKPEAAALTNRLVDYAHESGITEVVLWDHVLVSLDYYPLEFRTGPDGTIDLDNPAFWDWLKQDYRRLLDLAPRADGIVETFIETGARVEKQYSTKLLTNQQKLAAVLDAVAEVVVNERHLNLYARTFSYNQAEYDNVVGAMSLVKNKDIRLMMKETPHDFFLTHPNDKYAGSMDRPTLVEFDAAAEFNGQGIVANTWPEYMLYRWKDFVRRPHIIGYVARTDRYNTTRIVGRPSEINLLALALGAENPRIRADKVYDQFITQHYSNKGKKANDNIMRAFENAFDIITCSMYVLGTNVANHAAMNYEPYRSSYVLHVSGKWVDPPTVYVRHGVNREFHYWKDVVNHISPAFVKVPNNPQYNEARYVIEQGWITPGEAMDEQYLKYIVTEKSYGVDLAQKSAAEIEAAKPHLTSEDYLELRSYFDRTLLTARLYRAVASAYYGFRVWSRGGAEFQTPYVTKTVKSGLDEINEVAALIDQAPYPQVGQWDWKTDAGVARKYAGWIINGWPQTTEGFTNPNGGVKFPYP